MFSPHLGPLDSENPLVRGVVQQMFTEYLVCASPVLGTILAALLGRESQAVNRILMGCQGVGGPREQTLR